MTQAKPGFKNLLLVFGVALSAATLGIQASTMTSAKAQKPPLPETQPTSDLTNEDLKNQGSSNVNFDLNSNLFTTTGSLTNTSASSSLCYTCGGKWPKFGGSIPSASAATERNKGCGTFSSGVEFSTQLNDTTPYLCTK